MSFSKRSKIAVTGGAGYIGSFTVSYLKKLGFENLVILDNFSTGHRPACFARVVEIDLSDFDSLSKLFQKEKFDAVIHFASLIVVPHSMIRPYEYFQHNVNSSLNLLEAMRLNSVPYLVFSSTCAVYGKPSVVPITELEPEKPASVYAESKLMIEKMIRWYGEIFGLRYTLLRYFNACGADVSGTNGEDHNPETHLIPSATAALLAGQPISIYGHDYETPDKTCIRDYIHVNDLASAHHLALEYLGMDGASEIFNLGVGRGYSNLEVSEMIIKEAKKYGLDGHVEFKPSRPGDVPILYADSQKAFDMLKWQPKYTDLKKTIAEAFVWHKNRIVK